MTEHRDCLHGNHKFKTTDEKVKNRDVVCCERCGVKKLVDSPKLNESDSGKKLLLG